jgi:hypothetical protein
MLYYKSYKPNTFERTLTEVDVNSIIGYGIFMNVDLSEEDSTFIGRVAVVQILVIVW